MATPDATPMRIGALAEASDVTTRTIRYYESLGLLPEPERIGAHRTYRADDVARLRKIELYKDLGLSLDEIAELLEAYGEDGPSLKRRLAGVLKHHLDETDRKIAALKKLRKELAFRVDLVQAHAEHDERRRPGR